MLLVERHSAKLISWRGGTARSPSSKARERADEAAEALTERGKRRIIAAADLWLAHHPDDARCDICFDVMLVAAGRAPRNIANAFDASR